MPHIAPFAIQVYENFRASTPRTPPFKARRAKVDMYEIAENLV